MITSMVVGTDGSETAAQAIAQANELARALGAKVHLVSAYKLQQPSAQGRVREAAEETLRAAAEGFARDGVEVSTTAREGDAADVLLDVVEETGADLIVVGSKGMTGSQRFLLGSVPNRISHDAPCSVLIVQTA